MRKSAAALVASACLALAATAGAGIQPGRYTLSPFVGGYTFEGDENLKTAPVFGARLGYDYTKKFGVEGLVDFAFSNTTHGLPNRDVSLVSAGLEGLYYFRPDAKFVPFLAGGLRGYVLDDANGIMNRNRVGVGYGAGAKYFLKENLALRGDIRHLVFFNQGFSNLEYTLGLSYVFGGKVAPPPPPPAPAPAPVVAPPPPPPPASPAVSLSANPVSIEAGKCADLGWTSSNATNVSIDQGIGGVSVNGSKQVCPSASTSYTATASGPGGSATSAASVSVKQPPPPPPAAPSVSISANPATIQKGQCTNLAWNASNTTSVSIDQGVGAVDASGSKQVCPASDTSYTVTGSGPGGTRTASTPVSVTIPPPPPPPAPVPIVAPPPPAPKEPTKEELTIVLNIEFDTDKAVILPKYESEVARVAEFMKKYPQVKGVIEGHTDNIGGKPYNDKLSLKRANIVKKQLVDKYGIDGSRLTTAGFGFSKPAGDNGTPEGRQSNRRIVANFDKVTIIKP